MHKNDSFTLSFFISEDTMLTLADIRYYHLPYAYPFPNDFLLKRAIDNTFMEQTDAYYEETMGRVERLSPQDRYYQSVLVNSRYWNLYASTLQLNVAITCEAEGCTTVIPALTPHCCLFVFLTDPSGKLYKSPNHCRVCDHHSDINAQILMELRYMEVIGDVGDGDEADPFDVAADPTQHVAEFHEDFEVPGMRSLIIERVFNPIVQA